MRSSGRRVVSTLGSDDQALLSASLDEISLAIHAKLLQQLYLCYPGLKEEGQVWHGGVTDAPVAVLVLLAIGLALSLVFTGMAFVIALGFQDRAAGLAAAILAWLSATVLYDGLVLMAVVLLREYPLERPLVAGMLLNPVDLARVLLLLQFDLGALAGYTGAVFERFFGTVQGSLWSAAALLAWIAAPLGAGLGLFARKDF